MVRGAYLDFAGLEGAKEELLEDASEEKGAYEAKVGEDLGGNERTAEVKWKRTDQDAATAVREVDGDRVEVAVCATGVRDSCCDGERAEDGVEEDAV